MTLAQVFRAYLEAGLLNAFLISPRFSDYKITEIPFPDDDVFEEELKATIRELIEETGGATESDNAFSTTSKKKTKEKSPEEELTKLMKGDTAKAKNLVSYASDPQNAITSLIVKAGPQGAIIAAFIFLAFQSEDIKKQIVELITAPGGPLDKRLKIDFEKRMNAFMSRQSQRDRGTGRIPVTITQVPGFGNLGGALTVSSLEQIKLTGISRIGIKEKGIGLFF